MGKKLIGLIKEIIKKNERNIFKMKVKLFVKCRFFLFIRILVFRNSFNIKVIKLKFNIKRIIIVGIKVMNSKNWFFVIIEKYVFVIIIEIINRLNKKLFIIFLGLVK